MPATSAAAAAGRANRPATTATPCSGRRVTRRERAAAGRRERPAAWTRRSGRAIPVEWHRSTMAHLCSVYPFQADRGFGVRGVYIGTNVTAGLDGFYFDPFEFYTAGLVENPNMIVHRHDRLGQVRDRQGVDQARPGRLPGPLRRRDGPEGRVPAARRLARVAGDQAATRAAPISSTRWRSAKDPTRTTTRSGPPRRSAPGWSPGSPAARCPVSRTRRCRGRSPS